MVTNCDETIESSFPIRIQTTSGGGLAQFGFNSNRVNANSVWTRSIRINLHSMHIIFVV